MSVLSYPDMTLFHKLWTRSVGTPDYVKRDWTDLERMIEGERLRTVYLLCQWMEKRENAPGPTQHAAMLRAAAIVREEFLILLKGS